MSTNELQIFGRICADSSTYFNISDVLQLPHLISDIDRLFSKGKARVGYTKKGRHPVWVYLHKSTEYPIAICAKSAGLENWKASYSTDTDELAWMYIDALSALASDLRLRDSIIR